MAKAAIHLDVRRKVKSNLYPIKIRITHNRRRKYYTTGFYSKSQDQLDSMFLPKARKTEIKKQLEAMREKAENIIDSMSTFSFSQFESIYKAKKITENQKDVLNALSNYSNTIRAEGKISSANLYDSACISFNEFLKAKKKKKSLLFGDINIKWLKSYEGWMLEQDKSHSTIGIYLRNLRAVYNEAINKNVIPRDWYPFGKGKYVIPSSVNNKRALSFSQMNEIIFFDCPYKSNMDKWRDFFVFSYLCQGMNLKDILNLKWKNYNDDKLEFIREKTKDKNRDSISTTVIHLTKEAISIIEKWGNKNKEDKGYIFPIFDKSMDFEKRHKVKKQTNKMINKWVGRIAEELNFGFKPTLYYARHSYSTILRNSGVEIEYISQALAHRSVKTTQNYLDTFEPEKVKQYNQRLIDRDFNNRDLKISHKAV